MRDDVAEESGQTIRVAVVDDQPSIREAFTRALASRPDIEVVATGASGNEAVAIAAAEHPHVIVMDIRMPGLDGIGATQQIVAAGPHPPRVLVVTTFNLDAYVYEALRAGASGFLLKDAPPQDLVAAVRVVARGDAMLDPAVTRALIGAHAERVRPRAEPAEALERLTPRELEVLRLLARGMSNAEIAGVLVVTRETVKTYVSRLLAKLGLRDRVQAVVLAYRAGLADE
ncbi:response regulator transcription factor [Microbacterium sp. STN6]|uniref:response regulator n=1 Tax=Microbacterium sp. STN6 TaxID=2995588 RepID=UPI002260D739|nr:response regulator transcription factor [Microbacterium sp. STN6]MCX7522687.1 response regulator transcription factor [Microbacterium sp. STN6]